MTMKHCASSGPAVSYLQWNGTVHDFVFSNREYAQHFVDANERKTLSPITEFRG